MTFKVALPSAGTFVISGGNNDEESPAMKEAFSVKGTGISSDTVKVKSNDWDSSDYQYNGRKIEGFVLEDATGYMVKMKLAYYNFWKFMRSISHEAIKKGYIAPKRTSALITPLANRYYAWVKTLHDAEDIEALPKDICTLRKMFYATEEGKKFILE